MMKEKIWCWPFGIVGSLVSIYLFIDVKLYSEAILYSFYVLFGIYGWCHWARLSGKLQLYVSERGWLWQVGFFTVGIAGALGLGYYFQSSTDASNPFGDAFSTMFSFIATYLETQKILSGWLYWIILNAFSVYLYSARGLEIYAALMIVYFVLSIFGYLEWRKSYRRVSSIKHQA